MTILITGSSGKTSSRIASLLRPNHPLLVASRTGKQVENSPGVSFEWNDPATYENPFIHSQHKESPITAAYLVNPAGQVDVLPVMSAFIEVARKNGVRRFVLLSASAFDETTPSSGEVHKYLKGLQSEGVEWAVLRPSWFMENFSELQHHGTILEQSRIYSATENGRVPFISADDIAAVGARCLTAKEAPNTDYLILGPQLHSYDEVAAMFTELLGRPVHHVKLSEEQMAATMQAHGLDGAYAKMLAGLDADIARGSEERSDDSVKQVTGREPIGFRQFIENHKARWEK